MNEQGNEERVTSLAERIVEAIQLPYRLKENDFTLQQVSVLPCTRSMERKWTPC